MNRGVLSAVFGVVLSAAGCKHGESGSAASAAPPPAVITATAGQRVAVAVDENGYHPGTINAAPGAPLTLVFTRRSGEGCGQQLVFPSLNIRRDLPLNQPVEVAVVTPATGNVAFTCGMGMYRGALVAQ